MPRDIEQRAAARIDADALRDLPLEAGLLLTMEQVAAEEIDLSDFNFDEPVQQADLPDEIVSDVNTTEPVASEAPIGERDLPDATAPDTPAFSDTDHAVAAIEQSSSDAHAIDLPVAGDVDVPALDETVLVNVALDDITPEAAAIDVPEPGDVDIAALAETNLDEAPLDEITPETVAVATPEADDVDTPAFDETDLEAAARDDIGPEVVAGDMPVADDVEDEVDVEPALAIDASIAQQDDVAIDHVEEIAALSTSEQGIETPLPETAAPVSEPELAPVLQFVPAPTLEPVYAASEANADPALTLRDELDADLLPVFVEEGRDMLPQMGQALREWQQKPGDNRLAQSILRILHTVKGSARMAGAMSLGQHMHEMETRIEQISRLGAPSPLALEELLSRHDQGLQLFEDIQNPQVHKAAPEIAIEQPAPEPSAGMPVGTEAPRQLIEVPSLMPLRAPGVVAPVRIRAAEVATPATPMPLVRVRADILDRLVNQAGEVSISRSRLETEVGTLRQSLSELTENVSRLRVQLREIEMQAESQITSRMAHSADREFDPLEFDRFTRLQELTRMMAESVNDVSSVQQNLHRTVESASADLVVQGRLTRDLQQDLMRVRMVQFASISERLYRVTRQASKEVDKRVNLDIRGSAVEIDRGVLEKMVGPFEHLLRNAIVHGIESRDQRAAAGKNETGELLVEIRQEGN
ncbi:MAG: Hpt domain-containing protein, partial [Herminiimonas sp.]|nr:Hpt domain-containing protein [Herminiimonas sp.]